MLNTGFSKSIQLITSRLHLPVKLSLADPVKRGGKLLIQALMPGDKKRCAVGQPKTSMSDPYSR